MVLTKLVSVHSEMFDSATTRSVGRGLCLNVWPLAERAPPMHWIDDRKRATDNQLLGRIAGLNHMTQTIERLYKANRATLHYVLASFFSPSHYVKPLKSLFYYKAELAMSRLVSK